MVETARDARATFLRAGEVGPRILRRAENGFPDRRDKRPKIGFCDLADLQRPRLAALNLAKARRFEAFAPG
jgi:hypothetical protein